jgi:alkanesulfonate monooxygenase SsuD/methylene tetrahydromethanopterin reductase-like flavin-dependent oxidoreductase (luciferase family)
MCVHDVLMREPGVTDYGHELQFGTFITPVAEPVNQAVELAIASEQAGLDLVTFQDHPYQASFYDTWTLLTWVASQTERVRLSGNVLNLPLRNPAVLARSAATLDRLSSGRLELGIGAGGFWDAIAGIGGPRRTPGESVDALEEAIQVIRQIWDTDERGGVRVKGEHYNVVGAKRGPEPAHDIGIWVGAYGPRMLRLTGRLGDGWLPSLPYLKGGPADLAQLNEYIDEGARQAGREPTAIRRMLNIGGQFSTSAVGFLSGPPESWAADLAGLNRDYGISGFLLMSDDLDTINLFANEVAPATRELVR